MEFDKNNDSSHSSVKAAPDFSAVILPGLSSLEDSTTRGLAAEADNTPPLRIGAGENATIITPKALEFQPINTNGWPDSVDRNSEIDPNRQAILDATDARVGNLPSKSSEHTDGTRVGKHASAVSVSEILRNSGYHDVDAMQVSGPSGLEQQLIEKGFHRKPLSQAQPGDIHIAPAVSGQHDIASIIGKDGSIYNARDGVLTKRALSPLEDNGYLLAPPARGGRNR